MLSEGQREVLRPFCFFGDRCFVFEDHSREKRKRAHRLSRSGPGSNTAS
jgi:hypothetical protein